MAHDSAHKWFKYFLDKHATFKAHLLDVGGDGGLYEDIARGIGLHYDTVDLSSNATFDVTDNPYHWPIKDSKYDLVVSSSTFEHIEFPWMTFSEMCRVCKPNGHIYINAPSAGPPHWDRDYWRFYKDSMSSFAKWGRVELLESFVDNGLGCSHEWHDCVGIFKKP